MANLHVWQIVEGVENTKYIHPGVGCVFNESGDDIIRIVRVTDSVRSAEEHLEANVWDAFAEFAKTVPWVFLKKAH
jgi:hypothetical protein